MESHRCSDLLCSAVGRGGAGRSGADTRERSVVPELDPRTPPTNADKFSVPTQEDKADREGTTTPPNPQTPKT